MKSLPATPSRTVRPGFTIVEILVVLAIIGILMAVTIPALRGAQRRGRKTVELNNLRQVGDAWLSYAVDSRDRAIPGHLAPEVQARWKVKYIYPDLAIIPPGPDWLPGSENMAGPWTWRLLPYLNYDVTVLRAHLRSEATIPRNKLQARAEEISLEPGFGYNGFYLGGHWVIDDQFDTPRPLFSRARLDDGSTSNVVAHSAAVIQRSETFIGFCSTFRATHARSWFHLGDTTPGAEIAVPAVLANVTQWTTHKDDRTIRSWTPTTPPISRYTGAVATWLIDGHVAEASAGSMEDQSRWIHAARSVGDAPAREFSHSY